MPTVAALAAAAEAASGWRAHLELGFRGHRDRTLLVHRAHGGPMLVQSPFYPEGGVCHCYLLHPPGGVVGGDQLLLNVTLERAAHALLTTPAATKLYRSAGDTARMEQCLQVGDGCSLEWLPQECLAFSGARAHLSTRVALHPGARFLGWELLYLGRPASGEVFSRGAVRQDMEAWCAGEPLLLERNALEAGAPVMGAAWGMARRAGLATALLYPCEEHLLTAARRVLSGFGAGIAAATDTDGVLSCRLVSDDLLAMRATLIHLWQALRPLLLGMDAVAPRIWAT